MEPESIVGDVTMVIAVVIERIRIVCQVDLRPPSEWVHHLQLRIGLYRWISSKQICVELRI
jgi:hypothetical protein